ncbi:hypothetical protein J4430_02340 [Candidatus Woesearchaeota archaeon]|nr:hypothetical protein [Candidatus Woesearchaeota archaeon]
MARFEPIQYKITRIIQETPDTKIFDMVPVEGDIFDYKPSQFVSVILEGEEKNPRAFSIASSPTDKKKLQFVIKKEGIITTKMHEELKEGDTVKLRGPFGLFILKDGETKDVVFLAGGCGIAPLMSMLRYGMEKGMKNKFTMIASFKTTEYRIYHGELEKLSKKENCDVEITITRPKECKAPWSGTTSHITKEMVERHIKDIKNTAFYICGPKKMVESSTKILEGLGAKKEQIKVEDWG